MFKTSPTNQCSNHHLPKYPNVVLYFIYKIFVFSYRIDKVMIKCNNIVMLGSRFMYDFEIKLTL